MQRTHAPADRATRPARHSARPQDLETAATASGDDLLRSLGAMVKVRWAAAAFALLQVLSYDDLPYPAGVFPAGLALVGVMLVGNLVLWRAVSRAGTEEQARALAVGSLAFDSLLASGFVWLWAFDPGSALWVVLFIPPLAGAILFRLPGALGTWAGVAALYVVRELWGSRTYGYDFVWNTVGFRMGVGLLIALVTGLMARDLTRQRATAERALGRLQRVDRLRSGLVSTLAHDVRNPIAAIRGNLKTVQTRGEGIDGDTRAQLLSAADRQAERLERLANDLLDLARVEHGRLTLSLEDVPLAESVAHAVSYVDDGGLYDVRIHPGLVTRADPGRLEQIVVNLTSNALRYGKAPFVIEASRLNGKVKIDFRDHGPGVPPAERGQLFEPFRTGDHASSGLGLAIVKALVEAHGGHVAYLQNEPRGACFEVTLPLAPAGR